MNKPSLESELDKLKKSGIATYLEPPIDPLWNVHNQLVNSIQILLFILTKTSSIPVIPDYSKLHKELGITQDQSTFIQENNQMLLQLQILIIKYCVQQFTLALYIKQIMDEIVLEMSETNININMNEILDFIKNKQEFENPQMGGTIPMNVLITIILKFLFLLLIILPSGLGETSVKKQLNEITQTSVVPFPIEELNKVSPENFKSDPYNNPDKTSGKVNVNNMVVQYNAKLKEDLSGLIGSIVMFLNGKGSEDGQKVLEKIIESFNKEARKFSSSAEKLCIDLMNIANNKGVFDDWRSMDTLAETEAKIQNLSDAVNKEGDNIKDEMFKNALGAVATGATGVITGEYAPMVSYLSDLGGDIFEYLRSTKSEIEKTKAIVAENLDSSQVTFLSETDKISFKEKLFMESKLYCLFGYNLQLDLQGTNVNVIGDKIEYIWMIQLIDTLESNIKFKITQEAIELASIDSEKKNEIKSKQLTITILESLNQRLDVLKAITYSLQNIVNFSFKTEMLKLSRFPDPNNMEEFESFLKAQLDDLNKILVSLNKQFPKQESELVEEEKMMAEKHKLMLFEQNIKDMIQNGNSITRQRVSDRSSKELGDWWSSIKTIGQSWVNLGLNVTDFERESFGKTIESLGEFAGEGPLAILRSLLKFSNNVLKELLNSPSGWIIVIGGLFSLTFMFSGIIGTIKVFKKGGELFLVISWGGILFVYKLINTPFGYVYRQIATMRVKDASVIVPQNQNADQNADQYDKANYQAFLAQKEEGERYDPNIKYSELSLNRGGKRRSKGRKTRKHKKRRTKKIKNGKRRHTRHRKVRPTKRH